MRRVRLKYRHLDLFMFIVCTCTGISDNTTISFKPVTVVMGGVMASFY